MCLLHIQRKWLVCWRWDKEGEMVVRQVMERSMVVIAVDVVDVVVII